MPSTINGLHRAEVNRIRENVSNRDAKEIHFFEYEPIEIEKDHSMLIYHSWYDTINAINIGVRKFGTTQMGLLSVDLWRKGYRIFVHSNIDNFPEVHEWAYGYNAWINKSFSFRNRLFTTWFFWFESHFKMKRVKEDEKIEQ